jgi:hypothetical protein
MTKETRLRITELQSIARTARYNHTLAQKRLETAQRRQDDEKADYEYLLLGAWADTYECAKEDIYSMRGV